MSGAKHRHLGVKKNSPDYCGAKSSPLAERAEKIPSTTAVRKIRNRTSCPDVEKKYFSSPVRASYDFDWAFRNFVKKFILYVDLHQR